MWMSLVSWSWPAFSGYDNAAWTILAGVADLMVGDLLWRYHPARGLDYLIDRGTSWARQKARTPRALRWAGAGLTDALFIGSFLVTAAFLALTWHLSAWLFRAAWVGLAYTGLSSRRLSNAGLAVYRPLTKRQYGEAREAAQQLTGRDTRGLSPQEVIRTTVETLAEKTCNISIAPLFFLFLAGPPALWSFKAVDALSTKIGHRDAQNVDWGRFTVRVKIVLTWLPARLTGLALSLAAFPEGRFGHAWRVMRVYGSRHPTPNLGISDAAMAGALGVRLGGINSYHGIAQIVPPIGISERSLEPGAILQATFFSVRAFVVALVGFAVLASALSGRWLM